MVAFAIVASFLRRRRYQFVELVSSGCHLVYSWPAGIIGVIAIIVSFIVSVAQALSRWRPSNVGDA